MKEKINQLAKGIFSYTMPTLILSEESIILDIVAGTTYTGSFTISSSEEEMIKGVLYCEDKRVKLLQNTFAEKTNKFEYECNAKSLSVGDNIHTEICIVSNCGEYQIPVHLTIVPPYCMTSLGEVKDLFLFANLAKKDWEEALQLFQTSDFEQIFLRQDKKTEVMYQCLLEGSNKNQVLEEFLVTIHKKHAINLQLDKQELKYSLSEEAIMDKLMISKDSWGYVEISVSSDAEFIELEHPFIVSNDFVGNSYTLELVIDPKKMRSGRNFGNLIIETIHQRLVLRVEAIKQKENEQESINHKKQHSFEWSLTSNYLAFRMNKISKGEYTAAMAASIQNLSLLVDSTTLELIEAHLCFINGQRDELKERMLHLDSIKDQWEESETLNYLAFYYLLALSKQEEETLKNALDIINSYYENGYDNWKVLWFLLYLDKRYDKIPLSKWVEIRRQFDQGCRTPILYFEACLVLNQEAVVLKELSNYEIQVIHWGLKNDYLNKEAIAQFTYLAGRERSFHPVIFRCLKMVYEKNPSKEVLTAICSILIKGGKNSNQYFKWYRLGVESQIKITELHEYYMYSIKEEDGVTLAHAIMIYFIYNSNLSERKKAFLYANIIKSKETHNSIYGTYRKHIENFARKQLLQHNMSPYLDIIYNDVFSDMELEPTIYEEVPRVAYRYDITCDNEKIIGVYVAYKELTSVTYTPMQNGTAQIELFTEDAIIILVDEAGNRYTTTIPYQIDKLWHSESLLDKCNKENGLAGLQLLSAFEKIETYQKEEKDLIPLRRSLLDLVDLRECYKREVVVQLANYYYDHFETQLLEALLKQVDLSTITYKERGRLIEFCIIRELYQKAFDSFRYCCFSHVSLKYLIKLATKIVQLSMYKKEEWDIEEDSKDLLISMCHYIFKSGKYDEAILNLLVNEYSGTTKEMYDLWKAAKDFDIETVQLESRLLAQILFCESYVMNAFEVFMSYYSRALNHKLIRAFLSYYAYKYLVNDRILEEALFDIMKRESNYEENDICMLALLKHYCGFDELSDEDKRFADYNVHKFIERGIVLPFFKDFSRHFHIPASICDKYYVEYHTDANKKVMIHYCMVNELESETFEVSEMKNVVAGIFIKEFLLFYNEEIQYYITEEDETSNSITESFYIKLDNKMEEFEENKYNQINMMLITRELQDEKTLIESMKNYIQNEYIINQLFKPI